MSKPTRPLGCSVPLIKVRDSARVRREIDPAVRRKPRDADRFPRIVALGVFATFVAAIDVDYGQIGLADAVGGAVKWALLLGTSVLVLAPAVLRDHVRAHRSLPGLVFFGLFFAWGLASIAWSLDPVRTATVWMFMALGFVAGVAVCLRFGWIPVAQAMVVVGVLLSAASVLVELGAGPAERWAGVSDSPTSLARTGVYTCVFALCLFTAKRSPILVGSGLVVGVLTIVASGTRSALAIVVIGAVASLVSRVEARNRGLVALGGLASVGLLAAVFWGPLVAYATREDPNVDLAEANGRSRIWPIGLDYMADQPFHGYGLGAGQTLWARSVTDGLVNWFPRHAHQVGLELLLGTGVVGFFLFGAGCVWTLRGRASTTPFINRILIATTLTIGLTEAVVEKESMVFPVLGIAVVAGVSGANRAEAVNTYGGNRRGK